MKNYSRANEVIENNQEAVVVFTHGQHLTIDALGNGGSGNWVVNPDNLEYVDKIIIYLRDEANGINRIYLGNYSGNRKSPEQGRTIIRFSRLQEVGTTDSSWPEFASYGQNPVAYISK